MAIVATQPAWNNLPPQGPGAALAVAPTHLVRPIVEVRGEARRLSALRPRPAATNRPASASTSKRAPTSCRPASTTPSPRRAPARSGAETFQKDIAGVAKAAQSGSFKFRYVPGVQSGITIRVDALDGSGATIAGGTAPAVTLTAGKAVDAVLTLAINGNGVTCADATDCISGNCVDSVCCDTACSGAAKSCNVPGAVGQCSASMSGTDTDNDCVAKVITPRAAPTAAPMTTLA